MNTRITTSMIAGQFGNNLHSLQETLNTKLTHSYTFRSFDKASDNPLKASQAYEIQWEIDLNSDYQNNLSNVTSSAKTAESTLETVNNIMTDAYSSSMMQAVNGTMDQSNRNTIATQLENMRDSIVADMNSKYADQYLFAGKSGGTAPFSLDADGNLLYRGVNVDTGVNTKLDSVSYETNVGTGSEQATQINFGADNMGKLAGYKIIVKTNQPTTIPPSVDNTAKTITVNLATGATKGALQSNLQSLSTTAVPGVDFGEVTVSGSANDTVVVDSASNTRDIPGQASLWEMANEATYVDLGLGMTYDNSGKIVAQSAYNSALPGISFLGYGYETDSTGATVLGKDGNPVPKNICSLLTQVASALKNSGLSGQALMDQVNPLRDSFQNTQDNFMIQVAKLGTNIDFLDDTDGYLQNMNTNLLDKDNNVEYVDPASAILDYSQTEYSYNAALQAGTQILQKTLMDFLN